MSFDPLSDPSPAPAETPARQHGRVSRAVMAGGLAVGLALGGAGIAFAASSSTSSSTPSTTVPGSKTPAQGHGPRGFGGGQRGFGGPGGLVGLGPVVHGQFTERTASGGYQTVEIQVGKVTAVSATTITVLSTDKYSHSYTVAASTVVDAQRDGISSVAVGDQVQVNATTAAGKDTATNIVDTTKIGASRKGFGFGFGPGRPGGPSAPSAPAAPAAETAD
jgi:hypothetical protein